MFALKVTGAKDYKVLKLWNICRKKFSNVWQSMTRKATSGNRERNSYFHIRRVIKAIKKTVQKMAKELDISNMSLSSIVKDVLGLKSHIIQQREVFTNSSKQIRLTRCQWVLEEMRCTSDKVFVWSNEKLLTVEAVFNCSKGNGFTPFPQETSSKELEHIDIFIG